MDHCGQAINYRTKKMSQECNPQRRKNLNDKNTDVIYDKIR
jgi:hypothetical protein